jgi:hypothetical protein
MVDSYIVSVGAVPRSDCLDLYYALNSLQAHAAELFDGKQRLFLRMFAFDSGTLLHMTTHCVRHDSRHLVT